MANVSEPVQGSSRERAKVTVRLGSKGYGGRSRGLTSSTRGRDASRSNCRCLRSRTPEAETSKSRIFAFPDESPIFPHPTDSAFQSARWTRIVPVRQSRTQGKWIVSETHGGAGVGSWKKRMPRRNGADTGSEFAGRESELTSGRCLSARSLEEPLSEGRQ